MIQFIQQHPYLASSVATWFLNNIVSSMISSMPAPSKDSTPRYVYWFKVLNTVIGNIQRAHGSRIEDSPNFKDAVDKYLAQNGIVKP